MTADPRRRFAPPLSVISCAAGSRWACSRTHGTRAAPLLSSPPAQFRAAASGCPGAKAQSNGGGETAPAKPGAKPGGQGGAQASDGPTPVLPLALVQKESVKSALPFLGNLAYMMLGMGFVMTDILWLRLTLAGGYLVLMSFHALQVRPLRIPMFGSIFFVFVNLSFGAKVFMQRYSHLDEVQAPIYKEHFEDDGMTRHEFKTLIRAGEVRLATERMDLVRMGEPHQFLVLILDGEVEVIIGEEMVVKVRSPSMIGEISFLSPGLAASATAAVLPGCRYVIWNREELYKALDNEPSTKHALEIKIGHMIAKDLGRKLAGTSQMLATITRENSEDLDPEMLPSLPRKDFGVDGLALKAAR